MRRAARQDGNHHDVAAVFEAAGWAVCHTHQLGRGVPDLLVGKRNLNLWIEIKDGSLPPSKRQLTPDEVKWQESWPGPIANISSVSEAEALIYQLSGHVEVDVGEGETVH